MILQNLCLSECSDEIASLQQQIHCLQQELATKRAHVDSLSSQMSSLAKHQSGLKDAGLEWSEKLKAYKETLAMIKCTI